MEDIIETKKYRSYSINIYQDYDYPFTPEEEENEDLFLVGFHREFSVEREGFEREVCAYLMGGDIWDIEDEERAKEIKKEYHCFGLEAYIHGMVNLSLSYEGNYPDRGWDVSQLGVVFVKRRKGLTRDKARDMARDLVKYWNDLLSGNIHAFVVEKDGEVIDSCGGFVGDDMFKDMIEEAQSAVDRDIKERVEKKIKQVKAYIRNNVPLEKRV